MFVEPTASRVKIEPFPGGVSICIPVKRNWLMILFLIGWLIGWAFGEFSAIGSLLGIGPMAGPGRGVTGIFIGGWLLAWTAGGAYAFATGAFLMAGEELIRVESGRLCLKTQAFGLGFTKEYDLMACQNLRTVPRPALPMAMGFGGQFTKAIAMNYGASTISFGRGIDEPEAMIVIQALERIHKFAGS